ncbi:MAG TPA: hypothetical protein VGF45_10290 [Polyangia bacterium]
MTTSVPVFEVSSSVGGSRTERNGLPARFVELDLTLESATNRIAIRAPSDGLGRAEAQFDKHNWAAKHYWSEGADQEQVTIFEFDEALPAGRLTLRIPVVAKD